MVQRGSGSVKVIRLKGIFVVLVLICVVAMFLLFYSSSTGTINNLHEAKSDEETPSLGPADFKSWKKHAVTALKPEMRKNCQKIMEGNKEEIKRVANASAHWKNKVKDGDLHRLTANCSWVRETFENNLYTTTLEKSFPIAFSFTVYNSPQQVVRLLKVLYRSINQYCIHVDTKSSPAFRETLSNIAKCLENVHMATVSYFVSWGRAGVMKAQMQCLRDLAKVRDTLPQEKKWKYSINLCGKELPISTNHEIVSHLLKLNGSSAINAFQMGKSSREWRRLGKQAIPFKLPYFKSQSNIAMSFEFIKFLLSSEKAKVLYKFFSKCKSPEEHFYATVFRMPGVPGGFDPNLPPKFYVNVERAFWMFKPTACNGRTVHNICIVTAGDMKAVLKISNFGASAMFHNKYFMKDDHAVMDCAEERIVWHNMAEYQEENVPAVTLVK